MNSDAYTAAMREYDRAAYRALGALIAMRKYGLVPDAALADVDAIIAIAAQAEVARIEALDAPEVVQP